MQNHSPDLAVIDGVPCVSSLAIAEKFGKQHKGILRAIANALEQVSDDFGRRNFAPISYHDEYGREQPAFNLTRDGFSYVCMGFTGKEAAKWKVAYIEAFNAMEKALAEKANPKALPAPAPALERAKLPLPYPFPKEKIDVLLAQIGTWMVFIRHAEQDITDILTAKYLKQNPGVKPDLRNTGYSLSSNLSCSTASLWTSISFALRAIEDSIQLRLENSL